MAGSSRPKNALRVQHRLVPAAYRDAMEQAILNNEEGGYAGLMRTMQMVLAWTMAGKLTPEQAEAARGIGELMFTIITMQTQLNPMPVGIPRDPHAHTTENIQRARAGAKNLVVADVLGDEPAKRAAELGIEFLDEKGNAVPIFMQTPPEKP